jgi:hypothetical protein
LFFPEEAPISSTEPTAPDADPSAPTTRPVRRLALGLVAGIGVATIAFALWRSGEPPRQEIVAERGSAVMPFDLKATTHVFKPTEAGGIQTVVADDRTDAGQIALVRGHLADEAQRFQQGDFGDPAMIHGMDMPGLGVLESSVGSLTVSYRDVAAGGEITFQSTDPQVVQALHDWFAAQLSDHGPDARTG